MARVADSDELQVNVGPNVRRSDVNTFTFAGEKLPLMRQGGITKPGGWAEALAIISTSTPVDRGGYATRTGWTGNASTSTCATKHPKPKR